MEKSDFSESLFLELTSILLFGQLRIYYATLGKSYSAAVTFDTVGEEFYREAINLMLTGIDPALAAAADKDLNGASMFDTSLMKFRNEAQRYWPKGQRLLAAIQWPPISGGFQRELTRVR